MADADSTDLGSKREADGEEEESAKRQMTQPAEPVEAAAAQEEAAAAQEEAVAEAQEEAVAEDLPGPTTPPAAPAPLPDGWDEFTSKRTGKPYWYNAASRETTWVRPRLGQTSTPVAVPAATPAVAADGVGYPHRPGAEKCLHFMSHGRCKFGEACRYDHPPGTTPSLGGGPNGEFSSTADERCLPGNTAATGGLPVIAGAADCPFFMKTGMCKYGAKCKYNHPLEKQSGTADSTVKMPVSNKPPEMRFTPAGEQPCPPSPSSKMSLGPEACARARREERNLRPQAPSTPRSRRTRALRHIQSHAHAAAKGPMRVCIGWRLAGKADSDSCTQDPGASQIPPHPELLSFPVQPSFRTLPGTSKPCHHRGF